MAASRSKLNLTDLPAFRGVLMEHSKFATRGIKAFERYEERHRTSSCSSYSCSKMKFLFRLFRFPRLMSWCFMLMATAIRSEATPLPEFTFHDGDRVVLLGDTFIEREQVYGYFEERLTVEYPRLNLTFRNLGWSADTPKGESRASFDFDKPGKAFEKLKDQLAALQPNVVILGYGMANSFDGEKGLPSFKADMSRLMDTISSLNTNQPVRFVLLSPIHHEDVDGALPDAAPHNKQLARYTQALRELAAARNCHFISLFDSLNDGAKTHPPHSLTDNGIHLSAF